MPLLVNPHYQVSDFATKSDMRILT
jgi:hypothetical protein